MHRLRKHITSSNIIASLALFIALGGTGVAAVSLKRNSVGSEQIRTDAVGTSELRDRTIRLQDISRSARSSLRGATGAQGPAGPAGANAVKHFAVVSAAGGLVRGDATSGGRAGAAGNYTVGFADSIAGCAYSATVGTTDATVVQGGANVSMVSDRVIGVQTHDNAGAPADLSFHLLVAC